MNAQVLKNRLWVIEHYRYRYGADHTYWVHAGLRRLAANVNRYKFNYALKGLIAYQAYSAYQNYSYVDSMSFLSLRKKAEYHLPIIGYSGMFAAACLMF